MMLPLTAAAFSDIRDDEVRVAAETLAALDIVTGFEDGSFRPTSTLTRAQFAKMGVLSMGIVGGTTITLIADGSDEKEAVAALAELINSNFGE